MQFRAVNDCRREILYESGDVTHLLQAAYLLFEVRDAVKVAADKADLTAAILIRHPSSGPPGGPPGLATADGGAMRRGILFAAARNAAGRMAQLLQFEGVPVSLHPRRDQRLVRLHQLTLCLLL